MGTVTIMIMCFLTSSKKPGFKFLETCSDLLPRKVSVGPGLNQYFFAVVGEKVGELRGLRLRSDFPTMRGWKSGSTAFATKSV